jgi:hypothetical protein
MKNVLINIKSVKTGSSKAVAGAGAEKNSFGSATLVFQYNQRRNIVNTSTVFFGHDYVRDHRWQRQGSERTRI